MYLLRGLILGLANSLPPQLQMRWVQFYLDPDHFHIICVTGPCFARVRRFRWRGFLSFAAAADSFAHATTTAHTIELCSESVHVCDLVSGQIFETKTQVGWSWLTPCFGLASPPAASRLWSSGDDDNVIEEEERGLENPFTMGRVVDQMD